MKKFKEFLNEQTFDDPFGEESSNTYRKNEKGEFFDKNGNIVTLGDLVVVPDPTDDDIHVCQFVGTVSDILDNGNVIVIDQDSDFFEIESYRLEVGVYHDSEVLSGSDNDNQMGNWERTHFNEIPFPDHD